MNEFKKPEGKIIKEIFSDNLSKAQKLLDECKKRERAKKLNPIKFGNKTIYLVSPETDLEKWVKNKERNLTKYRQNDY